VRDARGVVVYIRQSAVNRIRELFELQSIN